MKNSLKNTYALWIENYLQEEKPLYRVEAKTMLAELKGKNSFDGLFSLVKTTMDKIKRIDFFSKEDAFAKKLKAWYSDLLQRQNEYGQFDPSSLKSELLAKEVWPLINLLDSIVDDPAFLMHTRTPIILKMLNNQNQLKKIFSHIVEQPSVMLTSEEQKKCFSPDHKATLQLYNNHSATHLETNNLSLMANSLLVNCLEIYQDLQPEEPRPKKCIIM